MTAQTDDARAPARALFVRVGEALYGAFWQEQMAAALGISSRSVRYWLAGRYDIPVGVWGELRALALERQEELRDLIRSLPK
jgi:hypothetical protein